jgi:hypothetical protein
MSDPVLFVTAKQNFESICMHILPYPVCEDIKPTIQKDSTGYPDLLNKELKRTVGWRKGM